MGIRIRTAVPALISEQGWTVKDVMEHCTGASVPKEMRKEVVGLHKTHGVTRAVEMTGVPAATMARWGNGKRPGRGQLSMGKRTWARLDVSGSDEDSGSSSKGGRRPTFSDSDQRKVVCAVLTGTTPEETAKAFGVSVTAVYKWRLDTVGLTTAPDYARRVKKFVAEVSAEPGGTPKAIVPGNGGKSRKHKSLAVKEQAVHRLVNEGLSVAEVAEEFGTTKDGIYKWRRDLLGKTSDSKFGAKARALAKSFMTAARASDQINGHAAPDLMTSASSMLSEVAADGGSAKLHVGTMEVLSNKLAQLDAEFESLGKDRKLVAQEMEIQQLRRQLSDR